jgi:hypothetical protein
VSALKLQIEEFDAIDFQLIAIHTALEDYRLAYYINQVLCTNLAKCQSQINIKSNVGETSFGHFGFEDIKKDTYWNLIQNKTQILSSKKQRGLGLFSDTESHTLTKVYLLPEYRKVDYFLKIENINEQEYMNTLVSKINTIERINTVYLIDPEKIKSKNNLIF